MISLRLLGEASLSMDGRPVRGRPIQRRQVSLLAILAEGASGTPRDVVMSLLWPEATAERARASLNQALHVLRKALGKPAILEAGGALMLNGDLFEVDLWDFLEAAEVGDSEAVVANYRGNFLEGFHTNSTEFEKWLEAAQTRIGGIYEAFCEEAADSATEHSHHVEAAGWWSRLVRRRPLNSRYVIGRATSLALSGDAAAALRTLAGHEAALDEELGIKPPEAVTILSDQIRSGEWSTDLLPPPTGRAETEPVTVKEPLPGQSRTGKPTGRLAKALFGVGAVAVAAGLWATTPAEDGALELDTNVIYLSPSDFRGSDDYAHLRDAVPAFLGPMIDGAGPLRIADPDFQPGPAPSAPIDSAASLALSSGAGTYVVSSILESSGVLRATAVIHETDSRAVRGRIITDDFRPSEVTKLLDQLAMGIFRELGHDALAPALVPELTNSAEAVRSYLEAESAHRAGDLTTALAAYEQALRHDSMFALARLRLATAESFKIGGPLPDGASLLRWRDRLPSRYQLLLDAEVASLESSTVRAQRLADSYRTRYPADAWGHMKFGGVGWHFGGWLGMHPRIGEQAMAEAIQRDSSWVEMRAKALWYSAHAEDPGRVRAAMEVLRDRFPESEWGTIATAGLALMDAKAEGRPAPDLQTLTSPLPPSFRAGPWWFTGDLEGMLAEMDSDVAANSSLGRQFFATWIPGVRLALGDLASAWRAFGGPGLDPWFGTSQQAYLALTPLVEVPDSLVREATRNLKAYVPETQTRAVVRAYLLGQLAIRSEPTRPADAWGDTLRASAHGADSSLAALSEHYAALVELHRWLRSPTGTPAPPAVVDLSGPLPDHLAHWWVTNPIQGAPFERWLRGELELARDNPVRAEGWYGLLGKLPEESHYTPLRHLRLAEIAAARGSADSARWHNTRVLRYWSADEPAVAGVASMASERLVRLGGRWTHPGPP